jgi:hypothetical protein
MIFRFLAGASAAALLAGCAVPVGQIRNGRFVSDDHGSLRITNQTVSFDLRDLPPGSRVKKRVLYRLRPDQEIDLHFRSPDDYRACVGAYLWRLEDGEIIATGRGDKSSSAIFYRPGKRRPVEVRAPVEPEIPAVGPPESIPAPPGDEPLPIIIN